MPRFSPPIGHRYHRLTVTGVIRLGPRPELTLRCDCGNVTRASASNLNAGRMKSCGCWRREITAKMKTTHGCTKNEKVTPEFIVWSGMNQRCYNANATKYDSYGGRGVCVCERWRTSFANFLADMGTKPSPSHSIDRYPNNDGNYEPMNCRWATAVEQRANRRDSITEREARIYTAIKKAGSSGIICDDIAALVGNITERCARWYSLKLARIGVIDRTKVSSTYHYRIPDIGRNDTYVARIERIAAGLIYIKGTAAVQRCR